MTTNKLEGRALHEAAARAMGWPLEMGSWYRGDGTFAGNYLSDRGGLRGCLTEREMLAWLTGIAGKSKGDICVNVTFSTEKSYVIFADCDRKGQCGVDYAYEKVSMRPGFHPEDLGEALARLVVAVAAREAKQA